VSPSSVIWISIRQFACDDPLQQTKVVPFLIALSVELQTAQLGLRADAPDLEAREEAGCVQLLRRVLERATDWQRLDRDRPGDPTLSRRQSKLVFVTTDQVVATLTPTSVSNDVDVTALGRL
jgi:hypothetical protein